MTTPPDESGGFSDNARCIQPRYRLTTVPQRVTPDDADILRERRCFGLCQVPAHSPQGCPVLTGPSPLMIPPTSRKEGSASAPA